MSPSEIREYVHKLVDEADEIQLENVLTILEPSVNKYSQKDLDSFNDRMRVFEEDGSKGYSVEQSHSIIRDKHQQS